MSKWQELIKGVGRENPVLRLLLGLCPVLAVSTSVNNALGMGGAATFVLVCSNLVISLIRKVVPSKIRIPIFIIVIATFVTIVDLLMQGFLPKLSKSLGLFIPLIVVNCIILGRAEAFASKNRFFLSIIDGLGMGIGFTIALVTIATFREVLGNGTWMGLPIFDAQIIQDVLFIFAPVGLLLMRLTVTFVFSGQFEPALLFVLSPGAFLTIGLIIGFLNWLEQRYAPENK
jgi:electron transport complex protein RnfE